jgi:L-arabinose isomerase
MKMLKAKIGFLPIACSRFKGMGKETTSLYEERIQKRLDEIDREASSFSRVTNPGQVYSVEDVKKAMDLFHTDKVDCIFAFFLSWSEDFAWIRFLRDMYPIPVFFAHIAPGITYKSTEDEDAFIEYLSTGGLVGALEGSGSLARFNRPMTYSTCGRLTEVLSELNTFSQASALRSHLRDCNFGLLAQYNEVMWSTYIDPYLFFSKIGPELRFLSIATLEDAVNKVSDGRVASCIEYLTDRYESRSDVEMIHFEASVKASLAMEDLARDNNISMLVLNDVDSVLYKRIGLRPGFYPTPENDGSIAIVPEGDLGVGLSVYIMKCLTGKCVNIIEPAYIENDGSLMVVHAGPNDYSDPAGKTIIARDVRFARSKWKHAGAPFAWYVIPPGLKTLTHISQTGTGRFKLVAVLAEALPLEHQLASYTHGCLTFPGKKTEDVCASLIREGVTQHYAVAVGDSLNELRQFAHLMDFDYVEL